MQSDDVRRDVARELHGNVYIRFPRRKTVQKGVGECLQADLVIMSDFADANNGYRFMLNVIDTFSKFGFSRPLKTKTAEETAAAFENILLSYKYRRYVKLLCCDRGREFTGNAFRSMLDRHGIKMFHVHTPMKASIVERWNRTIKNKMFLHFSLNASYRWYDVIGDLVDRYNNTIHHVTGMKPSEVTKNHEKFLLDTVYHNNVKFKQKTDLRVGDAVRISDISGTFRRGYLPNYSPAIFYVEKVENTQPVTFKLRKENGQLDPRGYYRRELKKVKHDGVYLVEKVLRTDTKRGSLVKWLGYDDSFNSWVK